MQTMTRTMIQTFTGKAVDLANFTEEDVRLPDISHALSLINRFTGHSRVPYSVAQHSVMVSHLVPDHHALWGLLHDASEAYLGDVSRPLKSLLPDYRELERHVQQTIARKFGLCWPMPSIVHASDAIALLTEKRDLLTADHDWGMDEQPLNTLIEPQCWQKAKHDFEERYKEITQW